MKELSIEEKAKAYDEALKEVVIAHKDEDRHLKATLDRIFPELKESDDELMIQYFKDLAPFDNADELYEKYGFSHKDAIAWLEKHGGHAKFINGIQVGDKVTCNEDGVLVNLSQLNSFANKQGEQKLLYVNDNAKEMFIKALERVEEQNKKGYKLTDCDKNSWWEDFKAYTSCIIEQKPAFEMKTPEESLGIDSDTYNKIVDECIYGEQKPIDKVEPNFKVGDWAVEIAREELIEEFIGKAITFLEGAHEYIDDKKLQLQYDNEGLIRDFRQFMRE